MPNDPKILEIIESLKEKKPCNKDYRCSTVDIGQLCKAKDNRLESFAECLEEKPDCNMAMSFGDGYLCTCPVRVYIAKTYQN